MKWYFNQLQNIALVLVDPAPVDVVDGVEKLVRDLGDLEPLDVLEEEEGESLPIGGRIE